MKDKVILALNKTGLEKAELEKLIEIPPSSNLGDYSFPCFILAKKLKKNPIEIAQQFSKNIKSEFFEKIEPKGPYINFFINRNKLAESLLNKISKEGEKFGSSKSGKNKKIIIEMSSPNIAKPFGIGHLRSTIIGNSLANIFSFLGYKPIKINYLGDWGTPFGKIILGYEKFGSKKELKNNPIKHLYELYVKVSTDGSLESEAREIFRKMEKGDKKYLSLWKEFRELSINDFNKIYSLLEIKFDVVSGESYYNNKMEKVLKSLKSKKLLEDSEGAEIVKLDKFSLGNALIKKSDGATLYMTRDLATAIDRYKKYKFYKMFYEVGAEQKLHFKQLFKILELLGFSWAKSCHHIDHGLYLDEDGKKFSTRKGKTLFMEDILKETIDLAKIEIKKREKLSEKELEERARKIALSAIIYGDLKNQRSNDIIFNIEKFLSFEGNTGPYLLYTYARAKSVLRKSTYKNNKKFILNGLSDKEKNLILQMSRFHEIISQACKESSPNIIANYAFSISQLFNEFYHSTKIIGSENQELYLTIANCFSIVLKNSLSLLGIKSLEKM